VNIALQPRRASGVASHPPPTTVESGPQHRAPLTPFRINTCKSVSKQTTLTIFRINTYAKPGEGGPLYFSTVE
jgi:hypothetical protein